MEKEAITKLEEQKKKSDEKAKQLEAEQDK